MTVFVMSTEVAKSQTILYMWKEGAESPLITNILSDFVLGYIDSNRALDKREYLMIIFLFLIQIICCDPSSEPSRQDGSDEESQHHDIRFYAELTKISLIITKYSL